MDMTKQCNKLNVAQENPKLATAASLERGADELDRLSLLVKGLGERLELVYMLCGSGPGRVAPPHEELPRINPHYMRSRARELRDEVKKECEEASRRNHADSLSKAGLSEPVGGSAFLAEVHMLARDIEISAENAMHAKQQDTRAAFIGTCFKRIRTFQKLIENMHMGNQA